MRKLLLPLLLFFWFSDIIAQNAADVETSFGQVPGFNGIVYTTAQQADGKLLVGGEFTLYKGLNCKNLVRLLADGTVDPGFVTETIFYFKVTSIILQPDGKILVTGGYTTPVSGIKDGVIRLNSDGSTDYTFSTVNGFIGMSGILDTVLQPDGKIIVVGGFTTFYSTNRKAIVRMNADGSIDPTFDPGTGFDGFVNSVALQADGKMIVAGDFTNYNGYTRNRIIRLNPDGTVDLSFVVGVGFNSPVKSVLVQPDGKIVAAGDFATYKNAAQKHIIRLLENGDKDTTLDSGTGFVISNQGSIGITNLAMDNWGNFIVVGQFSSYNGTTKYNCVKLDHNGALDNSFTIPNSTPIYSVAIQTDQKIILGGNNFIRKVSSNGSFDYSFNYGSGFNTYSGYYNKVITALQPDGKIIVGGTFTLYGLHSELGLIRLNTDGTKDTTFDVSYLDISNTSNIIVLPDGKIIVHGTYHYAAMPLPNYIHTMRLNPNGSQDTSFNGAALSGFDDFAVQADGKILTINGVLMRRFNTDGTVDAAFNIGSGFNGFIKSIALQTDGKIIAVGDFTLFNNEQHQRIVRLLPTGSIDPTFNSGEGFNYTANAICIQDDGKILVGGSFGAYNTDSSAWGLTRINANGTLDATFNSGFNINTVNSIVVQSDGKIIAGGYRFFSSGNYLNNLVRFNANGSLDTTFDTGTGFDEGDTGSYVSKIILQADGKILVSGYFKNYKTIGSASLVRLYGGNSVLSQEDFLVEKLRIAPNPAHHFIQVQLPFNEVNYSYEIIDLSGKTVIRNNASESSIDIQSLSEGMYLLKIKNQAGSYSTKFIKE